MADGINRKKTAKSVKRGKGGKFAKGTKAGPGRPRRQTETEYLDTLRETVTLDDWRDICRAMVKKARGGDVRAFEALCKWAMPQQITTEEDDLDYETPEGLS